jgi:hypothetical protein
MGEWWVRTPKGICQPHQLEPRKYKLMSIKHAKHTIKYLRAVRTPDGRGGHRNRCTTGMPCIVVTMVNDRRARTDTIRTVMARM